MKFRLQINSAWAVLTATLLKQQLMSPVSYHTYVWQYVTFYTEMGFRKHKLTEREKNRCQTHTHTQCDQIFIQRESYDINWKRWYKNLFWHIFRPGVWRYNVIAFHRTTQKVLHQVTRVQWLYISFVLASAFQYASRYTVKRKLMFIWPYWCYRW